MRDDKGYSFMPGAETISLVGVGEEDIRRATAAVYRNCVLAELRKPILKAKKKSWSALPEHSQAEIMAQAEAMFSRMTKAEQKQLIQKINPEAEEMLAILGLLSYQESA